MSPALSLKSRLLATAGLAALVATSTAAGQIPSMFAPNPFQALPASDGGRLHMVLGDVTSDGLPDAILGEIYSGPTVDVYICPGAGSSMFGAPVVAPVAPNIPSLVAFCSPFGTIDANGDGLLDVVAFRNMTTTGSTPFGFSTLINNGAGGFVASPVLSSLPMVLGLAQMAVADLDGDGGVDAICSGLVNLQSNVHELRIETAIAGTGYGFITVHSELINYSVTPVGVADVNGDGLKDVVYQRFLGSVVEVVVLPRTTSGGFGPPVVSSWPTQAGPNFGTREFLSADLNGDGYGDIVGFGVGYAPPFPPGPCIVATMFGGATCAFVPGTVHVTNIPAGQSGSGAYGGASLGDFDLDGVLDLRILSKVVRIQPAFGGASFTSLDNVLLGTAPSVWGERAADIDLDGDLDVVQAAGGFGQASDPTLLGVAINRTIEGTTCGPLTVLAGTPAPGNPAFQMGIAGAPQNSVAVLALSHSSVFNAIPPCVVRVNLAPGDLILPFGDLGFMTTDATGAASVSLGIPNLAALLGTDYFMQWLVVDPTGPLSIGGTSYSLTATRRIFLW